MSWEGWVEWEMTHLWSYEMHGEHNMAFGCRGSADGDIELVPGKWIVRVWTETGQVQVTDVFLMELITVPDCGTDYMRWWCWIFAGSWGFQWGAAKSSSATDATILPAATHTQNCPSAAPFNAACPQPRARSAGHQQNGRTWFPGCRRERFLLKHEFWVERHSRTDVERVKWYLRQARPWYVLTFIQTVTPLLCGVLC